MAGRGLIARSRSAVIVAGLGITLILAACSGPGKSDPTPTATAPPTSTVAIAASPTDTAVIPPTATATSVPTETPPPTVSPTIEPSATATITPPTPTATVVPLPASGAEVKVVTKAIPGIVQGNADGSVLYAVTSAGISYSTDGGRTWVAAGETPAGTMIAALNDPDVLYAGAHAACGGGPAGTALTRSTDGGQTWETFKNGAGIQPLLVMAAQDSVVIGTDCRLQVSTDGGQSWVSPKVTQNYDIYAAASSQPDALNGPIILLGISEGGTSGAWIIDLTTSNVVTRSDIVKFYGQGAAAWIGSRIVLATTEGVAVSNDNGLTWSWSRKGLESVTYSVDPLKEPIPTGEQGRTLGFSVVRIHPDDANHIWIGGQMGAFTSIDGGQTWAPLGDHSSIDTLAVSTTSTRVYVSANGGTRSWTLDEQ